MDADFEEWTRSSTPALLRAAFLLTGNQHSAEDLVQISLERVAIAWRRIDVSPDAYVRQVMYRHEVARWRRRKIREITTANPPDSEQLDRTATVDTRLALSAAMRRITPSQRAVLVLRFYEDMSEIEAASALNRSVGTVKSQTHKALRALRQGAPELAELVGRRLSADA